MFEFLANVPSAQVISVAYYAIRLINHRVVIQDDAVSVPQIAEASPEEQKLVLRVIEEVQRYERASLEDLSSREVERYVLALGRIAEERSRQEVQQAGITAEKADELLNELVEAQMAERELPGLRARRIEQIGVPAEYILSGDPYERALLDRKRARTVERDYIARKEPHISEKERLFDSYDYGRRREREYDQERGRADYGVYRVPRFMIPDGRMAREIIALLEERLGSEARNIEVYVEHREVLLTGTVYDRRVSGIAEAIAESVAGARSVLNQIHVSERDSYRDRDREQGAYGYIYGGGGRYRPMSKYRGLAHRREEDEEDDRFPYERGSY